MNRRMLVVRDAFPARSGGVEVLPAVASEQLPGLQFEATLRTRDGSERRTTAAAILAHIRGPRPPFAMIHLHDVSAEDVPAGTEIWIEG